MNWNRKSNNNDHREQPSHGKAVLYESLSFIYEMLMGMLIKQTPAINAGR